VAETVAGSGPSGCGCSLPPSALGTISPERFNTKRLIMTETNQSSEEIELKTPGQLLQQARLATGMSEEEVARRLNLRIQMVRDLEADNYGKSMASTYIKGYLKAYARLMQLSEAQVMDAYRHMGESEPATVKMQSFSQRTRKQAHHSRLMWLTYAIIAIIIVMFILWWLQAEQTSDIEQAAGQDTASLEAPAQPLPAALEVSPATENEEVSEAVVAAQPATEDPDATAEAQEAQSDSASTDTSTDNAEAVAEPPAEPVMADGAEIVMTFSGDCWVQVSDADGKVLLTGIRKSGQEARISGKPPFKLVLGAPSEVQLTYQGQPFDLSHFSSGKPARFKLPTQG